MAPLSPAEIAFEKSHINEATGPRTIGVTGMFVVLCSAALGGRFYARRLRKAELASDDYLVVAAHVFFLGIAIECFCLVHYGIGKHGVRVTLPMVTAIAKLEFALQLTYAVTNALAKASVLMLYRRVFSLRAGWFRLGWWANFVFVASYFIGVNIQIFLQCAPQPISHFWNPEQPCHPAGNAHAVVFGCWNALTDLTLVVLPIRVVWGLQMPRKQKVAVSGIFLLGLIGTLMAFMRLSQAILQDADFSYSTIDTLPIWTIEPAVAIICACLPVLRPLFAGILDKKKSTTANNASLRSYPKKSEWINIGSSDDSRPIIPSDATELQSSNKNT